MFRRLHPGALLASVTALALVASVVAPKASAQVQGDVPAASGAFRRGQALQLSGQYEAAADAFELADSIVPTPAALRSAILNRKAAGQEARAATLALRAQARDAADTRSMSTVTSVLDELGPRLTRVRIVCASPCTVSVSGRAVQVEPSPRVEFFVTPGPQDLSVRWERAAITQRIQGSAGETIERVLDAPPHPEVSQPEQPVTPETPPVGTDSSTGSTSVMPTLTPEAEGTQRDSGEGDGLSPVIFFSGAALTAIVGGVTIWSGLDVLSINDEYEDNPTQEKYDEGSDAESRTNVLIGATAVLGVATAVVGIFFTDWSGSPDRPQRAATAPVIAFDGHGAIVGVKTEL